jgi:RHS repeat-associated protein
MGRLTQVTFPSGSGNTATVAYDDLGQVTSQTDFGGKTTTYQYDYLGRVTKASDGVGDIGTSYDALGNVGTITDGNDSTTTYTYDGNNLLTKIIYANGAIVRYFYDTASRMTKRGAGASGTIDAVDFFIDGATGLLTRISYSSGGSSSDVFYAYDGLRRVTKLTDWIDGTDGLRYAYDEAGRLSVLTDYDDSTLTYTYDGAGNVLTMEDYHGSVVTYTYTDTDQVSTITAPGSKVWDYDYNALGHPTSLSIPNGMTTVYGYDVRNRLTKIEHKDGANVLDGSYYDLDDGGSITRKTYPDDEYWDYWYDGRDRLTKAERRDDSDTLLHRYTYTYDVGDNMITKEIYDGTDTDTYVYAHTVANELTKQSFDGTNTMFGYDAWGRMTSRSDGTYSASYYYNYGSKLTKVSSDFPDEGTVEYEYGGNGNRRERSGGGVTTRYNWTSGWSLLNEEDSAGNLLRTYVGDLANVNGSNPSSGSYRYYLHDHLGTVRQVRDQNVLLLSSFESTPFGETYSESGESQSKKYTGHDWDESAKLYYAPFRCYMPGIGKWTVRDPWGTFDGPNLYAYVHADPIGYADRWGLYTVSGDCTSCPYPDGKSYDKTERIKEQTDTWCGDLKNRITDPKLRTCLKDRCDSGKVTCVDGEECKGDEPGERGPLGYCASDPDNRNGWDPETRTWDPTKTSCLKDSPAYICVKNFVPLSSDDSEWGKTVIHEWAHSCGWKHHQTGTGVPPSR